MPKFKCDILSNFKQCEIGQKVWKVSESETNLLDLSFFLRNVQLSRSQKTQKKAFFTMSTTATFRQIESKMKSESHCFLC